MIRLIDSGNFKLVETKHGTKLLKLGHRTYAWIMASHIGSLLIYSTHPHTILDMLVQGRFRLYEVVDEPHLSDNLHLEVEIGEGAWQGYMLLSGFPDRTETRKRIIPTHEMITPTYVASERVPTPTKEAPRTPRGSSVSVPQ